MSNESKNRKNDMHHLLTFPTISEVISFPIGQFWLIMLMFPYREMLDYLTNLWEGVLVSVSLVLAQASNAWKVSWMLRHRRVFPSSHRVGTCIHSSDPTG